MITRSFYELYMSVLCSACESYRKESILSPFPPYFMKNEEKDFGKSLFSSPSKITRMYTYRDINSNLVSMPSGNELFKDEKELAIDSLTLSNDTIELVKWMVKTREKFSINYVEKPGDLVGKLTNGVQIPSYVRPDHVYEITYKEDEIFSFDAKKYGVITGFHGSSIENWYSILYNSLQNYSHSKRMTNGAAFGSGVYFCEDVSVAHDFLVPGAGWRHSILGKSIGILCVCDVIEHPTVTVNRDSIGVSKNKASYIIVPNPAHIRIKYLMIYTHVKDEKKQNHSEFKSYLLILFYIFVLFVLLAFKVDFGQLKRNVGKVLKF